MQWDQEIQKIQENVREISRSGVIHEDHVLVLNHEVDFKYIILSAFALDFIM